LHNEVKASGLSNIRTVKHGSNLYAWKAADGVHEHVKQALGIAGDRTEHGYFPHSFLKHNNYDINKTHNLSKVDYSVNEISTGLLARYAAKAAKSGMNTAYQLGQDSMNKSKERTRDLLSTRKVKNRAKGIAKAANNLASRDFTYSPERDDGDHEYR
jgi:hypothetical protein